VDLLRGGLHVRCEGFYTVVSYTDLCWVYEEGTGESDDVPHDMSQQASVFRMLEREMCLSSRIQSSFSSSSSSSSELVKLCRGMEQRRWVRARETRRRYCSESIAVPLSASNAFLGL
jgi:hypothetical protein